MPIRPQPVSVRCPHCGWHTIWQPGSDALSYDDLPPERCPHCGTDELVANPAGPIDRLLATLKSAIKKG